MRLTDTVTLESIAPRSRYEIFTNLFAILRPSPRRVSFSFRDPLSPMRFPGQGTSEFLEAFERKGASYRTINIDYRSIGEK